MSAIGLMEQSPLGFLFRGSYCIKQMSDDHRKILTDCLSARGLLDNLAAGALFQFGQAEAFGLGEEMPDLKDFGGAKRKRLHCD